MTKPPVEFDRVFSRGWRARPRWADRVWRIAAKAGHGGDDFEITGMFTSEYGEAVFALDGYCRRLGGMSGGATGTAVYGNMLRRYVAYELGIALPGFLPGERAAPEHQDLQDEVDRTQRAVRDGTYHPLVAQRWFRERRTPESPVIYYAPASIVRRGGVLVTADLLYTVDGRRRSNPRYVMGPVDLPTAVGGFSRVEPFARALHSGRFDGVKPSAPSWQPSELGRDILEALARLRSPSDLRAVLAEIRSKTVWSVVGMTLSGELLSAGAVRTSSPSAPLAPGSTWELTPKGLAVARGESFHLEPSRRGLQLLETTDGFRSEDGRFFVAKPLPLRDMFDRQVERWLLRDDLRGELAFFPSLENAAAFAAERLEDEELVRRRERSALAESILGRLAQARSGMCLDDLIQQLDPMPGWLDTIGAIHDDLIPRGDVTIRWGLPAKYAATLDGSSARPRRSR